MQATENNLIEIALWAFSKSNGLFMYLFIL